MATWSALCLSNQSAVRFYARGRAGWVFPLREKFGHTYKGREVGHDDTERSREVIKTLTFDNAKDLGEN